ncbi:MAG: hypothetical protein HQL59_03185 [Magnetococcales bacterium]|nr:hypothetical protein [Magnetococcales bacterium]
MSFFLRFAILFLGGVTLAFVAAVAGWVSYLPEPPWGDEYAFRVDVMSRALAGLFQPYLSPPPEDAPRVLGLVPHTLPLLVLILAGWELRIRLRNPWRLFRIRRRGGHTVLWGDGSLAGHLLDDRLRSGEPLLLAVTDPASPLPRRALGGGAGILFQDLRQEKGLVACGLATARQLIVVAADESANVEVVALASGAALRHRAPGAGPLRIVVHLASRELRQRLESHVDRFSHRERLQLIFLSLPALIARKLFLDHPWDRFRHGYRSDSRHLVIVGLGEVGWEILLQALRLCHHADGARMRMTMIDRRAGRLREEFRSRHPQAESIADLDFHSLDTGHEPALRAFLEGAWKRGEGAPTLFIVTLSEAAASLAAASAVERILRQMLVPVPPILLRCEREAALAAFLEADPEGLAAGGMMRSFGNVAEICADGFSLGERLDALARFIHERYLEECLARGEAPGSRSTLVPWSVLGEAAREDNRVQADHNLLKIREAGCRTRSLTGGEAPFVFFPSMIESLARAEHVRWCASRWIAGWSWGSVRDDLLRRHPDLKPYEELSEAQRELDRGTVRGLPAQLASHGLVLVRDLRLAVVGSGGKAGEGGGPVGEGSGLAGEGGGPAGDELGETLGRFREGLSRSFPDRHWVVVTPLATPGQRLACRVALDLGATLEVVLTEPVVVSLRGLAAGVERQGFLELVQRAEVLHFLGEGEVEAWLRQRGERLFDLDTLVVSGGIADH